MAKSNDLTGMPLAKVVQAWMDQQGWEDPITINEDRSRGQVATVFEINDQGHRSFIEIDEQKLQMEVFFYSPYHCPPTRMDAMARVLNRINLNLNIGRFACPDDENANPVQFRASIDLDGTQASPEQVGLMSDTGSGSFTYWGSLLAAVALTKRPVDELWEDFLAEKAAQQGSEEEEGPTEL